MTTVRESIALKVQAGGSVSLTAEEAVDVLKMIDELGRHELAAINHAKAVNAHAAQMQAKDREIENAHAFIAKERRTVRDMFICAVLGNGKTPDEAVTIADQTMARREGRRA
jgi:hypothetical protein